MLIYIEVSLALFCSPLKGKEVLGKIIKERENDTGNKIVSYKIDYVDKSDSAQSIFLVSAIVTNIAQNNVVKDTIHNYTARDAILVEELK